MYSMAVVTANCGMNWPWQSGQERPQPCSEPVLVTVEPVTRVTNMPSVAMTPSIFAFLRVASRSSVFRNRCITPHHATSRGPSPILLGLVVSDVDTLAGDPHVHRFLILDGCLPGFAEDVKARAIQPGLVNGHG